MNIFTQQIQNATDFHATENGALSHSTTQNAVYDLFAFGSAYRQRSDEDCIFLFKKAFEEDESLALKCLFYTRDVMQGQGERRFFRVCYKWLAQNHQTAASRNLQYIPSFGRWDDLIYICFDTPLEAEAIYWIKNQLAADVELEHPSLLAKWLPSPNASSSKTCAMAKKIEKYLGMTERQYRKTLSYLREKIKIVERDMSANQWDNIQFNKLPSKAGFIYRPTFMRRAETAERYKQFISDKTTKVHAGALYPYEIVDKAINCHDSVDREAIEKYWNNLPDYLDGKNCKILCVVDTSASMTWTDGPTRPINVSISLGMYCAERIGGPFHNCYVSFSSRPQLITIDGVDFVDKVQRIYRTNICENTNLLATFELIRNIAHNCDKDDIPDTLVIISDMEIDEGAVGYKYNSDNTVNQLLTEMETERVKWENDGLVMPKLVYWNVQARQDNVLDWGPNVSYVSGFSPILFESILSGKTGWDLCLEKLLSDRYEIIQ